ncbi:MAG: hypothetical protein NVS9B7_01900 [Flavisolibacter sp.]
MNDPLISICIPAYKRPQYLQRLLDSISTQSYKHFEIIISDDSPDESVKKLLPNYPSLPIRYFKNPEAVGTPQNWNLAIGKATGNWIKIMHDDDWFAASDSLQIFAEAIKTGNKAFIFSACTYIDENNGATGSFPILQDLKALTEDPLTLIYNNFIGHPSSVLHQRDYNINYNLKYKWVVDIDFYINYLRKHHGFYYIPKPLINIGTSKSQVSTECYKNPDVEIPEYLNLISSLSLGEKNQNQYIFYNLWNLAKKFKLKYKFQIEPYYKGAIPAALNFIVSFQRNIPRLILKQTPFSKYFMKLAYSKYCQQKLINKP